MAEEKRYEAIVLGATLAGVGLAQALGDRCLVLDRCGQDLILIPDGEEHFTVTLPVVVSPQFFGWLFGLDGGVELLRPAFAVEQYRAHLRRQLERYP